MPDLYIIAGPNGAGKSTYSSALVPLGVNVFDADKELARKEKEYPDIDPWHLMDGIMSHQFEEEKLEAIRSGKDFAYETNFSGDDVMDTPRQFREAGYRLNLIFLGLETVQEAVFRVEQRKKAGGHDVASEEIIFRYKAGLENLDQHIHIFDRTVLLASAQGKRIASPSRVYGLEKGRIIEQELPIPKWAQHLSLIRPMLNKNLVRKRAKGRK